MSTLLELASEPNGEIEIVEAGIPAKRIVYTDDDDD